MNSKVYKWCAVPLCKSTSIATPNKLFVCVPNKKIIRDRWLKLARRDPTDVITNSPIYFCEDHFDLPNDMENYMEYNVMKEVSEVCVKPGCVPKKFACQTDRIIQTPDTIEQPLTRKRKLMAIEQSETQLEDKSLSLSFEGNSEMNSIDVEQLIEVVKKYPVLYDKRHKFYNKFVKTTQAWSLVGEEMEEAADVLKKKWMSLKDGYRKYKRFQAGVAPLNKSWRNWCWGENLKFLDDFEIEPNNFKPQPSMTSSPSPPHQTSLLSMEGIYLQDHLESRQWSVTPSIQYGYKLGYRAMSNTDKELDTRNPKLDTIDHLFNSYAETFRKFSFRTQCLLKMQIAKIFADAETADLANASQVPVSADTQKVQENLNIEIEE